MFVYQCNPTLNIPPDLRRFRTSPKKTRDGDDGVDGPDLKDIAGIKNMRRKAAGAAADA